MVLSELKCRTCIVAKSHRTSYLPSLNKSIVLFTLLHFDVWGPSSISIVSGVSWFVIFVDDYTRMTWLSLMKNKDEMFLIFQSFHAMIQTQFYAKLRFIRSKKVVNMLISIFALISTTIDSFMKRHVLKHLSKMV